MTMALSAALILGSAAAAHPGVRNGWNPLHTRADSVELSTDVNTGTDWTLLSDTSCNHASGSAHLLRNPTRVLIAGGTSREGAVTQCTEMMLPPLSPTANWATASPLLLPRAAHAGASLNGTAYVFGGHLAKDTHAPPGDAPPPTATAEMLSPNGWVPAPQLPGPRTGVGAASLPDGRALIVGGFEGAPPKWSYLNTTFFFDGRSSGPRV